MSTEQNYNNEELNPTPFEMPEISSPPPVRLLVEVDSELILLHNALTAYRTTLYQKAADALLNRKVDRYVQSLEDIECADGLLTDMFLNLYETVENMPGDRLTKNGRDHMEAERLERRATLGYKLTQIQIKESTAENK